jgi:hypothetical protein
MQPVIVDFSTILVAFQHCQIAASTVVSKRSLLKSRILPQDGFRVTVRNDGIKQVASQRALQPAFQDEERSGSFDWAH